MIALVTELKSTILEEGKRVLLLSIYNDKAYVTPRYMRHVENATREVFDLIDKQAITGLNKTKQLILKGYNFLFGTNIQSFSTKDEAMKFLLDESTTDKEGFWSDIKK
jgi:hypothetical protein